MLRRATRVRDDAGADQHDLTACAHEVQRAVGAEWERGERRQPAALGARLLGRLELAQHPGQPVDHADDDRAADDRAHDAAAGRADMLGRVPAAVVAQLQRRLLALGAECKRRGQQHPEKASADVRTSAGSRLLTRWLEAGARSAAR
jgi:hypothetical protein